MLMKDNLIDPNYKSDSDAQNEIIKQLAQGFYIFSSQNLAPFVFYDNTVSELKDIKAEMTKIKETISK